MILEKQTELFSQYFDGGKLDQVRLKNVWDERKKELGVTQRDVRTMLNISSESAISHYLNGRIPLNLEIIIAFAIAMDVSVDRISPSTAKLLKSVKLE